MNSLEGYKKCECKPECVKMFKANPIRPNQRYAMGHGPRGTTKCQCSLECSVMIENPDQWGRFRKFALGHNARTDTERRAKQMDVNREASKERRLAHMATEEYKKKMRGTQIKRWETLKEKEPEKFKLAIRGIMNSRPSFHTEETKQKLRESQYGEIRKNPEKFAQARKKAAASNIGKHNGPEFVAKMTEILQSPERRARMSLSSSTRIISEATRRKIRERWKNPEYREMNRKALGSANGKKYPSEAELLFFDLFQINDIPLDYVGYSGFNVNGFSPDFVNEEKKVIVECYGDYFHNKEGMKDRDERRLQAYANAGYTVLVFWEHEVQKTRHYEHLPRLDEEEIVRRIKDALVSRRSLQSG